MMAKPIRALELHYSIIQFLIKSRKARHRVKALGSLSNYDDGHNDDFKKTIGLMVKTTALHVHHAF